jgi:hypothetical protein
VSFGTVVVTPAPVVVVVEVVVLVVPVSVVEVLVVFVVGGTVVTVTTVTDPHPPQTRSTSRRALLPWTGQSSQVGSTNEAMHCFTAVL